MACGSCGGNRQAPVPAATGQGRVKYRHTRDDGQTRDYFTKQQAEGAAQVAGGRVEPVPLDPR